MVDARQERAGGCHGKAMPRAVPRRGGTTGLGEVSELPATFVNIMSFAPDFLSSRRQAGRVRGCRRRVRRAHRSHFD